MKTLNEKEVNRCRYFLKVLNRVATDKLFTELPNFVFEKHLSQVFVISQVGSEAFE